MIFSVFRRRTVSKAAPAAAAIARAILIALLVLAQVRTGNAATSSVSDNVPPAVWAVFNGFMHCLESQKGMRSADGQMICGAEIWPDELQCLQHHSTIAGREVHSVDFPGRTIYGFQVECLRSKRLDFLAVKIEKSKDDHWLISVERPIN